MHSKEMRTEEPLLYVKLENETDKKKLTWQIIGGFFFVVACILVGSVAWRLTRPADTNALNMVHDTKVGAAPIPECLGMLSSGPSSVAQNPITKDTVCKCGDTAECGVGKYCTQVNENSKLKCGDTPQCLTGWKVTKDKCVCSETETCVTDEYCAQDGVFNTKQEANYKCNKIATCGAPFGSDPTEKLTKACMCPLQKGGMEECKVDQYCTTEKCADKPLATCTENQTKSLTALCSCEGSACASGKYCYNGVCHGGPFVADSCTATSEVCLKARLGCQSGGGLSTKSGVTLGLCMKDPTDNTKYVKYSCVKDGEISYNEYTDKDCKTAVEGSSEKYGQGKCLDDMVLYSWSGKCGGVSSAGSISTIMTFALAVLLLVV